MVQSGLVHLPEELGEFLSLSELQLPLHEMEGVKMTTSHGHGGK